MLYAMWEIDYASLREQVCAIWALKADELTRRLATLLKETLRESFDCQY